MECHKSCPEVYLYGLNILYKSMFLSPTFGQLLHRSIKFIPQELLPQLEMLLHSNWNLILHSKNVLSLSESIVNILLNGYASFLQLPYIQHTLEKLYPNL